MNRVLIPSSSNIQSAGWEDGILEVEFKRGSIYQYLGVPPEVFENLIKVESAGKYLAAIKNQFEYRLVFEPIKIDNNNSIM